MNIWIPKKKRRYQPNNKPAYQIQLRPVSPQTLSTVLKIIMYFHSGASASPLLSVGKHNKRELPGTALCADPPATSWRPAERETRPQPLGAALSQFPQWRQSRTFVWRDCEAIWPATRYCQKCVLLLFIARVTTLIMKTCLHIKWVHNAFEIKCLRD